MAIYQFVCGVAVVIFLSANGCSSSYAACGKAMMGEKPRFFPWQAVVVNDHGNACMGVLVSDYWVMTSSRCVYGSMSGAKVYLGKPEGMDFEGTPFPDNETHTTRPWPHPSDASEPWPTSPDTSEPWPSPSDNPPFWTTTAPSQQHGIQDVVCRNHTPYGHQMMSGMCLLKLQRRVHLNDHVRPVCLASMYNTHHSKLETYVLAGAHHPFLKKVSLVGKHRCNCHYPESKGMICAHRKMKSEMMHGYMQDDYMMEERKMDGYYMDDCESGVGAVLLGRQYDDTWTLLGVSNGDGICRDSEEPLFFYPLGSEQDWIERVTRLSSYSFNTLTVYRPDPDDMFDCYECPYPPPYECRDDSIFGGANMIPASPFVLLFVLALSLSFTKW